MDVETLDEIERSQKELASLTRQVGASDKELAALREEMKSVQRLQHQQDQSAFAKQQKAYFLVEREQRHRFHGKVGDGDRITATLNSSTKKRQVELVNKKKCSDSDSSEATYSATSSGEDEQPNEKKTRNQTKIVTKKKEHITMNWSLKDENIKNTLWLERCRKELRNHKTLETWAMTNTMQEKVLVGDPVIKRPKRFLDRNKPLLAAMARYVEDDGSPQAHYVLQHQGLYEAENPKHRSLEEVKKLLEKERQRKAAEEVAAAVVPQQATAAATVPRVFKTQPLHHPACLAVFESLLPPPLPPPNQQLQHMHQTFSKFNPKKNNCKKRWLRRHHHFPLTATNIFSQKRMQQLSIIISMMIAVV